MSKKTQIFKLHHDGFHISGPELALLEEGKTTRITVAFTPKLTGQFEFPAFYALEPQ